MSALATASAPNTGVNGVALTVLIVLFLAVTVMGFLGHALAPGREHGDPGRVGPGWPRLRHVGHVVPARR